jgi:hydroxymethylglutaryl-CoA lyase
MNPPPFVKIVEVGARDGLQNESAFVPTQVKLDLLHLLADAGYQAIEATSFVSPKWIPQMADHTALLQGLNQAGKTQFSVLVPNKLGMERALQAGAKYVAVFASASETFSHKNINCSIDESFERIQDVMQIAKQHNTPVRGYLSCCLGCPYEGKINLDHVQRYAQRLFDLGCYEISLGDTIGVGTPNQAVAMVNRLRNSIPVEQLAVHFHDTYGQALANIYAVLPLGIRVIDSSVAGLGGCPYAKGAKGNIATEDVLYMLHGLGYDTGIDLKNVMRAGQYISEHLHRSSRSKVALALQALDATAS